MESIARVTATSASVPFKNLKAAFEAAISIQDTICPPNKVPTTLASWGITS